MNTILFKLFCTIHLTTTTLSQRISRTATLSPFATDRLGASILYNINDIVTPNGVWNVHAIAENSWQFIISLDHQWGFDPNLASTISLTLNGPSNYISASDLLFGFTTDNEQYISMKLPMDNNPTRATSVFPGCSTHTVAVGDIASLPNTRRECDIAGGNCQNWQNAPFGTENLIVQPPITITLENNPATNKLYLYLSDPNYNLDVSSKCEYAAFTVGNGVKFYIGAGSMGQSFVIRSFTVVSTVSSDIPLFHTTTQSPYSAATIAVAPVVVRPQIQSTLPAIPALILQTTLANANVNTQRAMPALPTPPTGQEFGAFGQFCNAGTANSVCSNPVSDMGTHTNGVMKCERAYDCCLCKRIECGDAEVGCTRFSAGAHGAYGVANVAIEGDIHSGGAMVDCFGTDACAYTSIVGQNVVSVSAGGDLALSNARVRVDGVMSGFMLDCGGNGGCSDMVIELFIPGPPPGYQCNPVNPIETFEFEGIDCGGSESCKNLEFTLTNEGCGPVEIGSLNCALADSCTGANFKFNGDIHIAHCGFKGAGNGVTGVDKCFENLETLLCPDAASCQNAVRTLKNPVNGFMLNCGNGDSCKNARFTIDVFENEIEPVETFEFLKFSGISSGEGATITINNYQSNELRVENVQCAGANSCRNMNIWVGNEVSIGEIVCAPGACDNCFVRRVGTNMGGNAGIPCDPNL